MASINKVMIVDDDEIHNYLFEKRIRNIGLSEHVRAFTSGREAIQDILKERDSPENLPDVIFLDLQMPGMNGWDFLVLFEEALPLSIREKIAVFMLSSSILPRDIEQAKALTYVKEYIQKPLMEDELFVLKETYFRKVF